MEMRNCSNKATCELGATEVFAESTKLSAGKASQPDRSESLRRIRSTLTVGEPKNEEVEEGDEKGEDDGWDNDAKGSIGALSAAFSVEACPDERKDPV